MRTDPGGLTLDEKAALTAGADVWHTVAVERLGIPALRLTDGPSGARGTRFGGGTSLSLPCGTALAATWNTGLVEQAGRVLGDEARDKGAQVLLAPTVNLHRHPLAGRNFECFSEDPYLSAEMAVAYIGGVQQRGVGCAVKHLVANDQEHERMTISAEIDERTLREIYLRPFEAAVVHAGVWAVMAAYNRLNGVHCSEHPGLLGAILRDDWGFDGLVTSDWFGTHSTAAVDAGLDLEMPGPARFLGRYLASAVRQGDIAETTLDRAVEHLLHLIDRTTGPPGSAPPPIGTAERQALARRAAAESIVVLRNDGVLPLDPMGYRSFAILGPKASRPDIQGRGSAHVDPPYLVTPLEAMKQRAQRDEGDAVRVVHEPGVPTMTPQPLGRRELDASGVLVEHFAGDRIDGTPFHTESLPETQLFWMDCPTGDAVERFAARASATLRPDQTGRWRLTLTNTGRARVLLDGEVVLDNMDPTRGKSFFGVGSVEVDTTVELTAGRSYELVAEMYGRYRDDTSINGLTLLAQPPRQPDALARAVDAARRCDVAVVVVGDEQADTEGHDRRSMDLLDDQDALVRAVARVNPNTVVLLNTGAPMTMDWVDSVAAVAQVWYLGQETGNALADVLFGDTDASGRLATTIPRRLEDTPAHATYPGSDGRARYTEGLLVGYRHYDTNDVEPRFCFGHGLSYTRFDHDGLGLVQMASGLDGPRVRATVTVTNVGDRRGCEVVQAYVHDVESSLPRADQQLAGFAKVELDPGETATVELDLQPRAFAYWDVGRHDWAFEPGEFEVRVGASSRDIRLRGRIDLH